MSFVGRVTDSASAPSSLGAPPSAVPGWNEDLGPHALTLVGRRFVGGHGNSMTG